MGYQLVYCQIPQGLLARIEAFSDVSNEASVYIKTPVCLKNLSLQR